MIRPATRMGITWSGKRNREMLIVAVGLHGAAEVHPGAHGKLHPVLCGIWPMSPRVGALPASMVCIPDVPVWVAI